MQFLHNHKARLLSVRFFILVLSLGITVFYLSATHIHTIYRYALHSANDLSLQENARRIVLLQRIIKTPYSIEKMDVSDLNLIFRTPDITRHEANIIAHHYQSGTCAIDIYFEENSTKPDYIEFRTLSLNTDVENHFSQEKETSRPCLQDVLEARGINTAKHYAEQPVPSWDSPYRS